MGAFSDRYLALLVAADRYEHRHVLQGYYLETDAGDEDCDAEWCEPCIDAEVTRLARDCGERWAKAVLHMDTPHDTITRCHGCFADLCGRLTDYGANEELAGFEADGFDAARDQDCYFWTLCDFVGGSAEWRRWLKVAGLTPADVGRPDLEGSGP